MLSIYYFLLNAESLLCCLKGTFILSVRRGRLLTPVHFSISSAKQRVWFSLDVLQFQHWLTDTQWPTQVPGREFTADRCSTFIRRLFSCCWLSVSYSAVQRSRAAFRSSSSANLIVCHTDDFSSMLITFLLYKNGCIWQKT